MKNFITRAITGIIFVSLIIGSILLGEAVCGSLFLIFSLLATKEYCSIINKLPNVRLNWVVACICTLIFYVSSLLFVTSLTGPYLPFQLGSLGFLIYIIGIILAELLTFKEEQSLHNIAYYIFGQVVVTIPFLLLSFINSINLHFSNFDLPMLIFFFACIWLNDTGAYRCGTAFGKHKMAPNISPKKSWEGFVGGVFLVTFISTLLWVFNLLGMEYIFYSIIISLAATVGDLLESVFKRRSGVKDSGNLLPGHGGVLDRFDSILLASPILFFILIIFGY